ncbi:DUF4232 domain-containing protein [Streptomyces sp. NBC_00347]|uniref:DUF4232 domain-containing protein n=1 Tax=Streptomyces sp. NBC_00347 TaxID=2975721 RepID=UPI002251817B|nr:DUF4232 domain-containing protein [Streptomyces sp. NBC_00347]MCX5129758.1 DUF4232 domain-containing protein [Streptomyces sp. NBC_00347]
MNTAARTSRRDWKSYVIGAATVTALLASAACSPSGGDGPGDGKPTAKPSNPSNPSTTSPSGTPGDTGSPSTPKPGGTPSAKPSPAPSATGGSGDGAVAVCAPGDVSITSSTEDEISKGVRHILLTLTNTSQKACKVYRYPQVQIGDARRLVPEIKESAPTPGTPYETIAPGKQTHAALLLNGPMDEAPAKTMTVQLQDTTAGSKKGEPIKVALPGVDTVYYNDFAKVTHWMTASGLALRFIMSS